MNSFTPDNVRIGVIAKQYEGDTDKVEPWYGTQYKLLKIDEETLEEWRNAGFCDELQLPDKNNFIPTNFDLYPFDSDVLYK